LLVLLIPRQQLMYFIFKRLRWYENKTLLNLDVFVEFHLLTGKYS